MCQWWFSWLVADRYIIPALAYVVENRAMMRVPLTFLMFCEILGNNLGIGVFVWATDSGIDFAIEEADEQVDIV